jgi:hypothetical protein
MTQGRIPNHVLYILTNGHSGSSVQQSKNPSLVGCSGIVIHETENTFKIVTEKNSLKGSYSAMSIARSLPSLISYTSNSEGEFHFHVLNTALRPRTV